MELLREEVEPGGAGQLDESRHFPSLADVEAVAVFEPAVGLAVDGEEEFLAFVDDAQGDEEVVRQDDGAVAEGVGADGLEHEGGGFAVQDGAAGGEGVSGAADGGGDDESVADERGDGLAVDFDLDHGGARGGAPAHDDVVEGAGADDLAAAGAAKEAGFEQRIVRDAIGAGGEGAEGGDGVGVGDAGEEAEVAEVDAEDGRLGAVEGADGPQHGAIAAEGEQEIDGLAEAGRRDELGAGHEAGGFPVADDEGDGQVARGGGELGEGRFGVRLGEVGEDSDVHGFFLQ